jgi:hypothetical protein
VRAFLGGVLVVLSVLLFLSARWWFSDAGVFIPASIS